MVKKKKVTKVKTSNQKRQFIYCVHLLSPSRSRDLIVNECLLLLHKCVDPSRRCECTGRGYQLLCQNFGARDVFHLAQRLDAANWLSGEPTQDFLDLDLTIISKVAKFMGPFRANAITRLFVHTTR